jgi:hypothetical protein
VVVDAIFADPAAGSLFRIHVARTNCRTEFGSKTTLLNYELLFTSMSIVN